MKHFNFRNIIIHFTLLLYGSFFLFSQNIKGRVLESEDYPIAFAALEVKNKAGIITNEEGYFTIDLIHTLPTDSLYISCLGYKKRGFLVSEFNSQDYFLEVQVNELPEVILTNKKLSVYAIMQNVKKNISKNFKINNTEYKLFTRRTEYINGKQADFIVKKSTGFNKNQLKSFNDDFDQLEKSLVKNKTKQYTDVIGNLKVLDESNTKMEIKKAIRLFDKDNNQTLESLFKQGNEIVLKHIDKNKAYKVKSGLFITLSDSVSLGGKQRQMNDTINAVTPVKNGCHYFIKEHSFLGIDPELDFINEQDNYNYKLEDITYLGNDVVYHITFAPDSRKSKYAGNLYVNSADFAILKMDYKYHADRKGNKFNMKLILGVKYEERNKKGFAVYKQNDDGYYYPNYINEEIDRYFFAERPIKFIEQGKKRQAKHSKVSFDFLIEGIYTAKSEFLIISKNNMTKSNYNQFKESKKIEYLTPSKYDPSIWGDDIVIEPLAEMKAFENKKD